MKNLRLLACKFDLDQSERKSSQVHASPGQTESQVENLRSLASPFGQGFRNDMVSKKVAKLHFKICQELEGFLKVHSKFDALLIERSTQSSLRNSNDQGKLSIVKVLKQVYFQKEDLSLILFALQIQAFTIFQYKEYFC